MIGALLLAASLAAQADTVEVEPVTCWWRATSGAVRVGEPFTVVLTCSLLQTEAARVIADESRLEPSVVQLTPFEVIGGRRAEDITTAAHRFIQFEYRLRTIAENVFASEVAVPALEITYRVESRVGGGEALAGRDRTYALPPLTMRVLSLVPDTAEDIREAPVATFAQMEEANSRGTIYRVSGGLLVGIGALLLAAGIVRAIREKRAGDRRSRPTLPPAAVLKAARRELASIRQQAQAAGWTSDLVGRALAATRIVAAYATGQPVAQRPGVTDATHAAGEVVVRNRRDESIAVSSAVATADDEELRVALDGFAAARYGRHTSGERTPRQTAEPTLDDAVEAIIRRADRLIAERPWTERLWTR